MCTRYYKYFPKESVDESFKQQELFGQFPHNPNKYSTYIIDFLKYFENIIFQFIYWFIFVIPFDNIIQFQRFLTDPV